MNNSMGSDVQLTADELKFFNALVLDESRQLQEKVLKAVEKTPNPYGHLKAVSDTLIENQAELTARIKVIEQVLLGKSWSGSAFGAGSSPVSSNVYQPVDALEVHASSITNSSNTYGLERADSGVEYSWTGPSPELAFEIPVSRKKRKIFRLGFVSVADENLLQELRIIVDGESLPVRFDSDGCTRGAWCVLPKNESANITSIVVKLSRTVSPAELGIGEDKRRLGLAVTGYRVEKYRRIRFRNAIRKLKNKLFRGR